jgi:hypothetical protein
MGYTHARVRAHTETHARARACVCLARVSTYTQTHTHSHARMCVCACAHVCVSSGMRVCECRRVAESVRALVRRAVCASAGVRECASASHTLGPCVFACVVVRALVSVRRPVRTRACSCSRASVRSCVCCLLFHRQASSCMCFERLCVRLGAVWAPWWPGDRAFGRR